MNKLTHGTPQEAGLDPARIELIKKRGAEWIEQGRTPQVVLVAARRGVIALCEAFGRLTGEPDSPPLQVDSIFPVSSNTKPITATAVMILVEDGLVGLNRPVFEYIPEMTGYGREEILVHHLLTHTSGYDFDTLPQSIDLMMRGGRLPPREDTQDERVHAMLNAFLALKPVRAPGEQMVYSNENYLLLGEIVRRISGQSLEDFARRNIFDPLGMNDSSYLFPSNFEARLVRRSADPFADPNSSLRGSFDDIERLRSPSPGGGLLTTAVDMAVFAQTFLNGGCYGDTRILSPASVAQMTSNQIPGIGTDFAGWHDEASWGLGFRVVHDERWRWFDGTLAERGSFMHGGAGGTNFWVDPHNEIVGVYFSVCIDVDMDRHEHHFDVDLFQNMLTAAVVD